ncbi:hypothetical protein F0919_17890 [Taibaiella lutea]|uniref:Uncharacterized protein n=1 Tax=Taibaiella lutea TaxID=2608001 RepID=A0A5M6CCD5_9BACT|nr:hypothetical protein [Taibaiella lutea]KAA5532653.1 hypothetical protein F0919_17890 [Taibaiella lutea]
MSTDNSNQITQAELDEFEARVSKLVEELSKHNYKWHFNTLPEYIKGRNGPYKIQFGGLFNEDIFQINSKSSETTIKTTDEKYVKEFYERLNDFTRVNNINTDSILEKDIQNEAIKEVLKKVDLLKESVEELQVENGELKEIVFNIVSNPDNNLEFGIQRIPVNIYLDTDNSTDIFNTYTSILDFLDFIGFQKSIEFQAIHGSWIKRLIANSKKALTSSEVTDRIKEVEYGVEVNTILKPQSEIDKNNSEALLNILKSVENIPNAAIRIGSLIVVKVTNTDGEVNVQVRTLSIKELHLLNKRPDLLSKPSEILIALGKEINDSESGNIEL